MLQSSHRDASRASLYSSGMANADDEISAMLQSSHASLTEASLAGVMAPANSGGGELLTSFSTPYPPYQGSYSAGHSMHGGLARTMSMPQHAGMGNTSPMPAAHVRPPPSPSRAAGPPSRWAFDRDEKWVMEAKNEVFEAAAMRANVPPFGAAVYENSVPSGLQRYHSAPSTFLQSLAELNGDAFSGVGNPAMSSLFSEGGALSPITEQMDVERMGSGSSMTEFEQFLSPESGFSRRAALSALNKAEVNAGAFGTLFPAPKGDLVRQKSSPAATLAQLNMTVQDRIDENGSEESISGTSEDNNLANGMKASMYSQDDFLLGDSLTSWKSPTSPGNAGGKRQRGLPGESDTSSGSAEGSITYRHGPHHGGGDGDGGLIRHMSLPTTTDGAGPSSPGGGGGFDDFASFGTVQMRTRAKRGCATHPRSIAERVRRTRISERMKKLQDLVPNMDKQTNTSDMLDETVEYVKSLQVKVRELTETVAKLKAAQEKSP